MILSTAWQLLQLSFWTHRTLRAAAHTHTSHSIAKKSEIAVQSPQSCLHTYTQSKSILSSKKIQIEIQIRVERIKTKERRKVDKSSCQIQVMQIQIRVVRYKIRRYKDKDT